MFVIVTDLNGSPYYLVGVDSDKVYWAPDAKWAQPLSAREDAEMVLHIINKPMENRLWSDARIEESDVYSRDEIAYTWIPETAGLQRRGMIRPDGVLNFERDSKQTKTTT